MGYWYQVNVQGYRNQQLVSRHTGFICESSSLLPNPGPLSQSGHANSVVGSPHTHQKRGSLETSTECLSQWVSAINIVLFPNTT